MVDGSVTRKPVMMEYAAEASYAPLVAIRDGAYKSTRCSLDPEQLFHLPTDPQERVNLVDDPAHVEALASLRSQADKKWDLDRFDEEVRRSQARRWVVYDALRNGACYPWDYQPLRKASERFMHNHLDLNNVEENQRFPRGE